MALIRSTSRSSNCDPSVEFKDPKELSDVEFKDPKELSEIENAWYHPAGFTEEEAHFMNNFTEEQRLKVIKKIDWRLVPVLALLYLISHLDRSNIGNANIEGLSRDLKMSGSQYNIALCVFFVPYILLEVPANMILKKFRRPSWWIAILVVSWGVVMTLTGIVKSYEGLIVARFFLGAAEAGFFPGAILIVSNWYVANEVGTRIALFYTSSALAGAFSGLLAFAIVKMDGAGGLEGWRWIFILEGIISVAVGVAVPWILIDSPEQSKWLSQDEKRFLKLRKEAQDGGRLIQSGGDKITWLIIKSALLDWKIYLQAIIAMSNTIPVYGLKFTMPQIIKNMGFTSSNAQLLTIPPYSVAACSAYISCRFADRFKWRMPFIAGPQLCVLVAFSVCFAYAADIQNHIGECYFGVVLACVGLYPIIPGSNAWNANNLAGPMKRAVGIGLMMAIANGGGLVGSFIYIADEAPMYPTGFGTSLAIAGVGCLAALTLELLLWRINQRDAQFTEEEIREKYTDEQLAELGDKSPLFKYTL